MLRKEIVRLGVLREIADDYEEPVHIYDHLAEQLGACQVGVKPEDIKKSLIELVELGLAKGYWLHGPRPVKEVEGVPPLDSFQNNYFWITDEGCRALNEWRHEWPFDDEDRLIEGWSPPEN